MSAGSVKTAAIVPSFERCISVFLRVTTSLCKAEGDSSASSAQTSSLLDPAQFSGSAFFSVTGPARRKRSMPAASYPSPRAQKGFFSADLATIDPGLPNVPVGHLRLGEVRAGGADRHRLCRYGLPALGRHQRGFVRPSRRERRQAEAPSTSASGPARAARAGQSMRSGTARSQSKTNRRSRLVETESFALIVKPGNGCGGIGAMKAPAAQLGAFSETLRHDRVRSESAIRLARPRRRQARSPEGRTCTDARGRSLAREEKGEKPTIDFWREFGLFT